MTGFLLFSLWSEISGSIYFFFILIKVYLYFILILIYILLSTAVENYKTIANPCSAPWAESQHFSPIKLLLHVSVNKYFSYPFSIVTNQIFLSSWNSLHPTFRDDTTGKREKPIGRNFLASSPNDRCNCIHTCPFPFPLISDKDLHRKFMTNPPFTPKCFGSQLILIHQRPQVIILPSLQNYTLSHPVDSFPSANIHAQTFPILKTTKSKKHSVESLDPFTYLICIISYSLSLIF